VIYVGDGAHDEVWRIAERQQLFMYTTKDRPASYRALKSAHNNIAPLMHLFVELAARRVRHFAGRHGAVAETGSDGRKEGRGPCSACLPTIGRPYTDRRRSAKRRVYRAVQRARAGSDMHAVAPPSGPATHYWPSLNASVHQSVRRCTAVVTLKCLLHEKYPLEER